MIFKEKSFLYSEKSAVLFLIILFFISVLSIKESNNSLLVPIPTEVINKKKDRKKFKEERQEWMQNMHRAAPDVNWKKMDQGTRLDKITAKTLNRKRDNPDHQKNNTERTIPAQWYERGSNNQAGRIRTADVDFENSQIYCASSGGNIWRGSLDGTGWESLNDYFQITGIHLLKRLSYNNFQRMIIDNNKNCYRSDNDGYVIEGASGLESIQNWGWVFRSVIKNDGSHTIYLGAIEWDYSIWTHLPAIYKSVDGGESFTRILELTAANGFVVGTSNFDLWASQESGGPVYVINDGKCYMLSSDDALTLIGDMEPSESGNNILIGGVDEGDQIYLHARVGSQLYSSFNGGISWAVKGALPTGTFTINSFACAPNNPDEIVVGNVDGYRSTNGGDSWELINNWWEYYSYPETRLHADLPEFNYFIDPESGDEFQLISTDGGIYISYDHFDSVQNISMSGLGVSQYYSTYTTRFSPHHVFAGSQDQGFQRHLSAGAYDGVLNFEQTISGDYGHIVSGDGGSSLWTDYPGFVMYYDDIANSTNMVSWDFEGGGYLWLPPLMIDPYQPNVVYIGGGGIESQNHMVRVTYGISGMESEDIPYTFDSKVSAMAFSPVANHHWYVSTEDGKFYYSTTMGQEFTQTASFSGPESHYFYGSSILPSPVDNQRIYIGGSGYSNPAVYLSTNGGGSFVPFDNGLPNTLVYEIVCLPDVSMIFAATEVGPYAYSFDEGHWEDISADNAPDQTYWTVDYIHEIHTVRFGTYGRGIWDYTFDYNPVLLEGDLNQDETVNVEDLIVLVEIVLTDMDISDYVMSVGDLNYDASIDLIDILILADMLAD